MNLSRGVWRRGAVSALIMAGLLGIGARPAWALLEGADGYVRAVRAHARSGKPIIVLVYTDWCPYCRRLNNDVLAKASVRRFMQDVLEVRLNPEHGSAEQKIARDLGVGGYPSMFITAWGASQAQPFSPYTRRGDDWILMSPEEFVKTCQQAAGKPAPDLAEKPAQAREPEEAAASAEPSAQKAGQVTLHLTNGRKVTGELVAQDEQEVTLGWDYGTARFPREMIRVIEPAGTDDR